MNFFHRYFLNDFTHFLETPFIVYFNRQDSQRSTYFLGKYYSPKYLNVKISHSRSVRRCYVKKVLLKVSKNSQGNTCPRVSFLIKLQAWGLKLYLKKGFWQWYCKTRVTSYELRVTSWKLKSTSWNSKARDEIQIHELRVRIHEFKNL